MRVRKPDSLVLARQRLSVHDRRCVGDFDRMPEFVADERDLYIR